jgi:tetratricopeptide (TPR) repeat protein
VAWSYVRQYYIYEQLREPDLALEYYYRLLEDYEYSYLLEPEVFDEPLILLLMSIGEYQLKLGRLAIATATYEKLLGYYSKEGPLEGMAEAFYLLGTIFYQQNNLDKALTKFLSVLKIYESFGDLQYSGLVHYYLGCIFLVRKDFEKSAAHLNLCLLNLEKMYLFLAGDADKNEDKIYQRAIRLYSSLRKKLKA